MPRTTPQAETPTWLERYVAELVGFLEFERGQLPYALGWGCRLPSAALPASKRATTAATRDRFRTTGQGQVPLVHSEPV